jgi:hypothetical protein
LDAVVTTQPTTVLRLATVQAGDRVLIDDKEQLVREAVQDRGFTALLFHGDAKPVIGWSSEVVSVRPGGPHPVKPFTCIGNWAPGSAWCVGVVAGHHHVGPIDRPTRGALGSWALTVEATDMTEAAKLAQERMDARRSERPGDDDDG